MTLKKTIAGYRKETRTPISNGDGTFTDEVKMEWIDQKDVEMHPLEQKEILAHWAIHDVNIKIPAKPSQLDEHEMLINEGAEAIKKARTQWQAASDAIQPELQAAHDYHQQCVKEWHAHIEKCVELKVDPDTHEIEKYKNG